MERTKKFVSLLIAIVIAVGAAFVTPQTVMAKKYDPNVDIWEDIARHEQIGLLDTISNAAFELAFSNYCYNNLKPNEHKTFDFSKASKRRYVLKWHGIWGMEDDNFYGVSTARLSQNLFGRSTSGVKEIVGDVGDSYPSIGEYDRLWGLYQVGNNKYKYTKTIYMIDYQDGSISDTLGFVEYTLKKSHKSDFGWIVTKAKVTRN